MLQYTLISVDNPDTVGNSFVGLTYPFSYNGQQFTFGSLRSSTVSSIEHYDGNLTVITRNTVYKFKQPEKE